jgi:hypothetical protein
LTRKHPFNPPLKRGGNVVLTLSLTYKERLGGVFFKKISNNEILVSLEQVVLI